MKTNAHEPFPFSVGFPLVIRPQSNSLAICGANRGEGWPILCEVPRDTHHDKDARSIVVACTAYLDLTTLRQQNSALVSALEDVIELAESYRLCIKISNQSALLKDKSPRLENARAAIKAAQAAR